MTESPANETDGGADADLAALIGSRICHDLISPIGAIGNGVELMSMSGEAQGPELALIGDSVTAASARIRFFRVAFGAASETQRLGHAEIGAILGDLTRGSRLSIDWQSGGDQPRFAVKLAFLGLLCLETAMPYGGTIRVSESGGNWSLTGRADKLKSDPALWDRLTEAPPPATLPASAHVQFMLLPREARRQGRHLALKRTDSEIEIRL